MRPSARLAWSLACFFGPIVARGSMRDTLSSARLLSGLVDTRVIRMDLAPRPAAPPQSIYALVVAFDRVLWLYTPGLGTNILGPFDSDAALRSDALAARVRQIAPAAGNLRVYPRPLLPAEKELSSSLSQGCFAGCLLQLADLLAADDAVTAAGVVFFSRTTTRESTDPVAAFLDVGHSVLVYRTAGRWFMLDPGHPAEPLPVRDVRAQSELDPALTAHATRSGYPLERVRFLPFSSEAINRLAHEAAWRAHPPAPNLEP